MVDDILFQERIYDLVNGYWDLTHFPVAESEFVMNEFAEGSFCNKAYGNVLEAYNRLCSRLACGFEDNDVEIILNEMNRISKYIAIKMFQYGVFFARRDI